HPKGQPGQVYLGSYRTDVFAASPQVHVDGSVRVVPDLNGDSTRAELAKWQSQLSGTDPAGARGRAIQGNLDRLQERLNGANQIGRLLQQAGAQDSLSKVLQD